MLRHALLGFAAATLLTATLMPDDAQARGFRGGGGGFHGGALPGGGFPARAGYRPIPGRPYARAAVRGAAYRGAAYGAAGAAAVGAAAAGAGYYYNNCYRDSYGRLVCPNQYQYGYLFLHRGGNARNQFLPTAALRQTR